MMREGFFPLENEATILLADDEPAVRDSMKKILEEFGFTVIEAADGEDAVEKFMENRSSIHLLFFDVAMPKKSGLEAYEEIKKVSPHIKAIFISGYAENIMRAQKILEEDLNFITKPVQPHKLVNEIRRVLQT